MMVQDWFPIVTEPLTVDDAILKLSELAGYSFADFLTVNEDGLPQLDFETAASAGALQVVKKFTVDRYGKVTIELYSVLDILQMILRVFGKISATASGIEGAGGIGDLSSFTADDLVAIARKFEATFDIDEDGDDDGDESAESD